MYSIFMKVSRRMRFCGLAPLSSLRMVFLCSLMACMLVLSACSSKTSVPIDPFIASPKALEASADPTKYLPKGSKPFSPAEKRALMSVGAFDKNISAKDMIDVMMHFKRYVHDERKTIEKGIKNGQPYIAFMRQVMRQHGLPQELAYLAFVESLYIPTARSRTGALGMWQFISSTGKAYGMRQDYWVDERYDIFESTRAAATYLGKLNKRFDDWHLAITSYNAGQGKVGRGLEATGSKTFFELRRKNSQLEGTKNYLTEENRQYLPKFLAICKIMRNLESLGFEPMQNIGAPPVVAISLEPDTDLKALARSSQLSWSEFKDYNPTFKRTASPPGRKSIAYVPRHSVSRAKVYIAQTKSRPARNKSRTQVASASSSQRNSSTASNQKIKAGYTYQVVRGDTMSSIARRSSISLAQLRSLNPGIEPLKAGARVRVPKKPMATDPLLAQNKAAVEKTPTRVSSAMVAQNASARNVRYVVQDKDTIWAIARKFDVHPNLIMEWNSLNRQSVIRRGDVIKVKVQNI